MNTNTHVAPLVAVHWREEEGGGEGSWKFDRCDAEIKYGMYRTGTRGKITKNRLLRNCLKERSYEGISPEAVPLTESSTSMRIRQISFGNGQGFKKCFCQDYSMSS